MRSYRSVLLPATAVLALFCIPAVMAAPPNFVVINIDDMGYADIGPFGSKIKRTPNLDRMAKEGRKLTCFYAAPVCSPSRASLMTGCYPKRVLPIPGVLFPGAAVGLNPAENTIADLLKEVGYTTACIGKWHLGDQPEFLPTKQGFDYYLGIPYSNDMKAGEPQLYNLTADIGESKDVATENPEEVKRLLALADAMKDDLGLNAAGPGVRPLGRVANPQPLIGKDGTVREGFKP
jgi:arylsulfatase A